MTDRLNTPCDCGGTFVEHTIQNDWNGTVTCDQCLTTITRYNDDEAQNEKVQ